MGSVAGGGGAGVDVCQTRQRARAQAAAGAPAPPAQFSSRSMIARISRLLASAGRCYPNAETGGKQAFKQRGTAQQHVVNTRLHCLNRCHTARLNLAPSEVGGGAASLLPTKT